MAQFCCGKKSNGGWLDCEWLFFLGFVYQQTLSNNLNTSTRLMVDDTFYWVNLNSFNFVSSEVSVIQRDRHLWLGSNRCCSKIMCQDLVFGVASHSESITYANFTLRACCLQVVRKCWICDEDKIKSHLLSECCYSKNIWMEGLHRCCTRQVSAYWSDL